jgi:chorismate mutase
MKDLEKLREDIDLIDKGLLKLLAQRLKIAQKIGESKQSYGLPVSDKSREQEVKVKWKLWAEKMGLEEESVLLILAELLHMSKKVQEDLMK